MRFVSCPEKIFLLVLLKIFLKNVGDMGDFKNLNGGIPYPVPPIFAPNGKPWGDGGFFSKKGGWQKRGGYASEGDGKFFQ